MAGWSRTSFHISTVLRVPLAFAFRWCTDFRPDDGRREGSPYERRILERTPRRVVFEDLESTSSGWEWTHHTVSLRPPNRWHSDGVGNYRDVRIDYELTRLAPERTRIDLTWKRRWTGLAGKEPSKRSVEVGTLRAWRHFAKSIEADYRRSRRRR